jgi:DNA-binding MarR family transcriptional regulator
VPDRGTASRLSDDELAAWQGLLRANAWLLQALGEDLRREHGLSRSGYDVLLQLGLARRGTLRMSEIAQQVLMSHNGISRVVAQLEADGLVVRERQPDDGRVVHATLTPAGRDALRAATRTHFARVRELFLDRLSDAQLRQLREIWDAVDPALVRGRARVERAVQDDSV